MGNRNSSVGKVSIFFAIGVLLLQPATLSVDLGGTDLLNVLHEKDQKITHPGHKISFRIATGDNQFRDPNQGTVFKDCAATWITEGTFAMKVTYHYEKQMPVFAPPGSGGYQASDYDEDGNLIVWRSLEKHVLFAPDRNEEIETIRSFFIDPNGTLVNKGSTQTKLFRYPIGNTNHMFEFSQFELAVGRGFSKHLKTVTSLKPLSSGLTELISHGSRGPQLQGTWEMTIDPNSDYIVRKGTFTPDGSDTPTIISTSDGVISQSGVTLARHGNFKYSTLLELAVEVTSVSEVVGTNDVYEEVVSRVTGPLAPSTQIIDLRGEKPVITTVN